MNTIALRDGDIYLDESGNIASLSDIEALRQDVETYLKTIKGEYMFNKGFGIDYFNEVFIVGATKASLTNIFDAGILKFNQVISITNSSSSIDKDTRTFSYAAIVQSIYGQMEVGING